MNLKQFFEKEDLTDVASLAMEKSQLKADIEDIYIEIGKKIVESKDERFIDEITRIQEMNLKIEIKKILKGDKPTKAYANIVIDDAVVIHGVGVVENEKGRYMSMPMTSWKTAKGEEVTRPVCHPISSSARKELEEALFSAYEQEINKNN